MRINGRNHSGPKSNTCARRKRTKPTNAERLLQRRLRQHAAVTLRPTHKPTGPEQKGYRRPGSLKKP